MNKSLNLIEGKVLPSLLQFTIPILLSLVLQTTYGSIDLLIVGQFALVGDVSGVTIGSQLMTAVTAFCTGLSMGTTILIGRFIGANQKEKTSSVIGNSIVIFLVLTLFVTIILLFSNDFITKIMQTPVESINPTKDYLFYSGIGTIFMVSYNLLGSIFRAIGDSNTPLIAVAIACVLNIILDLILVAYFDMGAAGAAIATTIAQGFSVVLSLILLKNKTLPFSFSIKDIKYEKEISGEIISLGLPAALQTLLGRISFICITAILNTFGVSVSAAAGIVSKITNMIMLVPSSFMQAISVFTAQNYGARKLNRAKLALKYSIGISLFVGVFAFYISIFHGNILIGLFTSDPLIIEPALLYLKIYAIDTILVSILFCTLGYFNGYGETKFTMIQSLVSSFFVRIPFTYFLSRLPNTNLFITGLGIIFASIVSLIVCAIYYIYYIKPREFNMELN